MRYLRYLRTFRGPSCLHLFLRLGSCYICYFCDSCDICNEWFLLARKILVTFAIFAIFAGHFGALLAFIFFYVLNLVTFVILAIFAIFVTQSFTWQENVFLLLRFLLFLLYTFLISVFFATIAKIIC